MIRIALKRLNVYYPFVSSKKQHFPITFICSTSNSIRISFIYIICKAFEKMRCWVFGIVREGLHFTKFTRSSRILNNDQVNLIASEHALFHHRLQEIRFWRGLSHIFSLRIGFSLRKDNGPWSMPQAHARAEMCMPMLCSLFNFFSSSSFLNGVMRVVLFWGNRGKK